MKTLDDVIAYFDNQTQQRHVYLTEDAEDIYNDALHYLKYLQKYYEMCVTSQNFADTSQIICPKCHSEFVILDDPDGDHQQLLKCQALLQDFYRNDPLTWNELKEMEGKPVWLEYNLQIGDKEFRDKSKRWCIIGEFKPWHDTEITITENGFVLSKREQINSWQAYRKERP